MNMTGVDHGLSVACFRKGVCEQTNTQGDSGIIESYTVESSPNQGLALCNVLPSPSKQNPVLSNAPSPSSSSFFLTLSVVIDSFKGDSTVIGLGRQKSVIHQTKKATYTTSRKYVP